MAAVCRIWARQLVFAVLAIDALAQEPESGRVAGDTGRIAGYVREEQAGVAGAVVVVCDQASGMPFCAGSWMRFDKGFRRQPSDLRVAHAVTDEKGRFAFEDVPAGEYRIVAQSWIGRFSGVLEVNGSVIQLHGTADHVRVPSADAEKVFLANRHRGVLHVDEEFPNSDSLLLISTVPPLGDPVLGFTGLGQAFMNHIVAAARLPYGMMTVVGLPQATNHIAVFAVDSNGGFGFGAARAQSVPTTAVPIVCGWSNGQHFPPPRIQHILDVYRDHAGSRRPPSIGSSELGIDEAKRRELEEIDDGAQRYAALLDAIGPLEGEVKLPNGETARLIDVLAAARYLDLHTVLDRRNPAWWEKQKAARNRQQEPR